MFKSIRWRIAAAYVALIVISTFLLAAYLLQFVREDYLTNLQSRLVTEARLVADRGERSLSTHEPPSELGALAKRLGSQAGARVTIIDRNGVVLGDSHENPATMENHAARPEVLQALAAGLGESNRHSATVGFDMMYVAVPITVNDEIVGVARVAVALTQIDQSLDHIARTIGAASSVVAFLAVLIAMYLARATTQPVNELRRMAMSMAAGNLDRRIRIDSPIELRELGHAFNQMAARLKETIAAISDEHGKLSAILAHMADGIIITDGDGKVTLINPAAIEILAVSREKALGHTIAEVVRDHELVQLVHECQQQALPGSRTRLVQLGAPKRFLRAVATPVTTTDAAPEDVSTAQYLVVLQDLTEIRRSEAVRREFIANVSHELRTPLSSIKALVETLQDGAIDDPAVAKDFLAKMDIEVDELTQMVRELLELSRIESGQVELKMVPTDVGQLVRQAAERMRAQAERGGLQLAISSASNLPKVVADGERIQQVLINLIHNAIKFTPPPGTITVSAHPRADDIVISVADTGAGIAAADLGRIFERFFKADRSRSSGGTGLGLAIAKHTVQAHGGKIWVESRVPSGRGKGSTFYLSLPTRLDR